MIKDCYLILRRLLFSIGMVGFFLVAAFPVARGENMVSVKTHQITPLSANDIISNILVSDGRLVALGRDKIWILNEAEGHWNGKIRDRQGQIRGIVTGNNQSFLLPGSVKSGLINKIKRLNISADETDFGEIPPLPMFLTSAQGSVLGGQIFIAGTTIDGMLQLFSIDLSSDHREWHRYIDTMATDGRITSVVAQNAGLFATVSDRGGEDHLLQWQTDGGWTARSALSGSIIPGSARPMGQANIIYIVKDLSGRNMRVVSFHTVTGAWTTYGMLDAASASFATGWKKGIVWGQPGENGTGATFSFAEIKTGQHFLHGVDWFVIAAYLLCMLGVGVYFYSRNAQDSEGDFFLGGRSIPFWAAGISLYASNASSISYIAVPAKAFATNWQYLMSNLIVVIGLIFVAVWIVPLLRRLNLMSIFQYLETRFHPAIRVLSSALFIVFQLGGRMTIILFLPSLAISTVTGMDITLSILVMGGITVVYTVLGGMKAVIWSDVMQLFVMFGGTIFAIIFIMSKLDGGVGEFLSTALADHKMKLVDWHFNLTGPTVWGFVFLVFFDTILTFPKDQVLMQRVLSTRSAKEAGRSVWIFAAIVIPGSIMFYLIGTALYVFYQSHPERLDPFLSIDATFPLFIAAELPVGITGLIIAGIFAASMSTLSSILNSVATVATVDFYEKIVKIPDEKKGVRFAEIITVAGGVIGIGLALLMTRFEISSLLDLALELWGLLGGGFAGAYTLGMFTRRANWQGVAIGVAVSIAITVAAWTINLVHPYFYLPLSILICIIVGYAASWLFPAPKTLEGLTIYQEDTIA